MMFQKFSAFVLPITSFIFSRKQLILNFKDSLFYANLLVLHFGTDTRASMAHIRSGCILGQVLHWLALGFLGETVAYAAGHTNGCVDHLFQILVPFGV